MAFVLLFYYTYVCVCTMCGRWFSSTMWILGIELRSLGLAASAFTCWAILSPNFCFWDRFSLCGPEISILPPQPPECWGHRLAWPSTKCFASVTYVNCKKMYTYISKPRIIFFWKMLQFNRQKRWHLYYKNKKGYEWIESTGQNIMWKWPKWSLPLTIPFLWKHLVMMATQYL